MQHRTEMTRIQFYGTINQSSRIFLEWPKYFKLPQGPLKCQSAIMSGNDFLNKCLEVTTHHQVHHLILTYDKECKNCTISSM